LARDCPADAAVPLALPGIAEQAEIPDAAVWADTLDELVALVASQVFAAASVSFQDGPAAQFGFAAAPDGTASACYSALLRGDPYTEPVGSRYREARRGLDASRMQGVHDSPDENPVVGPREPYDRR